MRIKQFLVFLFLCLLIYLTEGRGGRSGGGRSRSSGRSGGWGKSWGSSSASKPSSSWGSSGSSYKPSSSWSSGSSYKPSSSWNSGSSSSHSYPSSISGLSGIGIGTGISSSSGHKYPSSTGLSGSGGSHSYPSSTGLSGSGSGSHSYPSSGTGLSGSGSGYGSHSYPSSNTGLSGSGSKYPSWTGLSNSGSNYKPSSSSGTHSYPSGTQRPYYGGSSNSYNKPHDTYYQPTNTYHTNTGYGSTGYHPGSYVPHTYYTAPQHVYVTQYRDSGSRYGDLLTGLALYDLGRSHSHYHNHYYHDDYYRTRYNNPSSSSGDYRPDYKPENEAVCTLRIKENGKISVLKVPCEIVSTFTEGSKKIETQTKVCTSNVTIIKQVTEKANNSQNITSAGNVTSANNAINMTSGNTTLSMIPSNSTVANITTDFNSTFGSTVPANVSTTLNSTNAPVSGNITNSNATVESTTKPFNPIALANDYNSKFLLSPNMTKLLNDFDKILKQPPNSTLNKALSDLNINYETTKAPDTKPKTAVLNPSKKPDEELVLSSTTQNGSQTITNVTKITPLEKVINITVCNETKSILNDPLSVRGPPVDPSKMECAVDIKTKDAHLRNTVDCKILMEYSKKPVPKKDPPLLPSRQTLKSWMEKPPWWTSLFIAF